MKTKRFRLAVIRVGVLSISALGCWYSWNRYEERLEARAKPSRELFRNGEVIAKALDAYYQRNRKYPPGLNVLIPEYLKKIPKPNWGINEWGYRTLKDGQEYEISVLLYMDNYIGWYYDGRHWVYDT